ncbi:hypothetical protein ES707_15586 [subsurface metagenome]
MFELLLIIVVLLLLHFVIGKYPEPLPRSENPRREIWETLGLWGLIVLATTIAVFVTPLELIIDKTVVSELLGNLALFPFWVLIPLLYVTRVNKWTAKDMGFTKPRSLFVFIFALLLFGYAGTEPLFLNPGREPMSFAFILSALYQPAFTEEFLFRGIIQGKLEKALGQNKAWFYSGILFGLAHASTNFFGVYWYRGGADIGNAIGMLIMQTLSGWIFGIIYMKSRSLLPGFLAHFFTDWRLGSIIKLLFF